MTKNAKTSEKLAVTLMNTGGVKWAGLIEAALNEIESDTEARVWKLKDSKTTTAALFHMAQRPEVELLLSQAACIAEYLAKMANLECRDKIGLSQLLQETMTEIEIRAKDRLKL